MESENQYGETSITGALSSVNLNSDGKDPRRLHVVEHPEAWTLNPIESAGILNSQLSRPEHTHSLRKIPTE